MVGIKEPGHLWHLVIMYTVCTFGILYLPVPSELNRKFQQDTTDEMPQDRLY